MNRKEAAEIAAYSAAVKLYKANAIMCHLMPGDTFRFPHTDTRYKAGKSCLAAVLLISHAQN